MGEIGYFFNLVFTFPILNGLMLLYHLFGDFGLSIVVLTLIIKLILFPLTVQQLKSTKANQALQPKMQELKKKYANDQQAQALALQTLYKEAGINPIAGCLPLFIQMPVLYGLYFAMNNVLRDSKMNVGTLRDHLYPFVKPLITHFPNLSLNWFTWLAPIMNPLLHVNWAWSISLGAPDPTHVLPILAGLATFIQLRMSQPKPIPGATVAANDPTQQTMKTMQYIMPLFTVFIGWTFVSGLALYWTISSIFQAAQQYFVTGWGALLVTPNLKANSNGSSAVVVSSNGSPSGRSKSFKSAKPDPAREIVVDADEPDTDDDTLTDGPVERNLRTVPRSSGSGPSQYTRRQRGGSGSASARRRSGRR